MATPKIVPPPLTSPPELLAMARAIEQEAARRYRELAARMRLKDEPRLAALFDFLAAVEEKHAGHVAERGAALLGQPVGEGRAGWEVPENFADEEGSAHLLTPYRALAIAVRNEERAFAFYSYVSAQAPNDAFRRLAEELAKDELAHAVLLRRERRLAYRAEGGRQRPSPAVPETIEEFWALAAAAEWRTSRYHRAVSESGAADARTAASFAEAARDEAQSASEMAARSAFALRDEPLAVAPTVEGGLRLIEEGFERYADIAERSHDERVVQEAQRLAARSLRQLSLIGGASGNALLDEAR